MLSKSKRPGKMHLLCAPKLHSLHGSPKVWAKWPGAGVFAARCISHGCGCEALITCCVTQKVPETSWKTAHSTFGFPSLAPDMYEASQRRWCSGCRTPARAQEWTLPVSCEDTHKTEVLVFISKRLKAAIVTVYGLTSGKLVWCLPG